MVRKVLKKELGADPQIEVVGVAPDPYIARELIVREKPDVITLDLEMPRMDGISFLRRLMRHFPIPTIVVSSLTPQNSEMAITALECGAVDIVCKPSKSYSIDNVIEELIQKIKLVSKYKLKQITIKDSVVKSNAKLSVTTEKIVAIGASTGGTKALERIIPTLPVNFPGTVITQHMPKGFTKSFADRLNSMSSVNVKEADDGESVITGKVLIAPGDKHLVLNRSGARYIVNVVDGEKVCYQRPSVDVLFNSVAKVAGKNAFGVLLTGMGKDGAEGLLKMKQFGSITIAQDEDSSIVWGMPGEAVKIGAAMYINPLMEIVPHLLKLIDKGI